MFKRKFIDKLREKYQTGGELATTYGGKLTHAIEGLGHIAPKVLGTAGRVAGAVGVPLMLADFYQRGQRLSGGKVNVNQKPFLQNSLNSGPKVFGTPTKSLTSGGSGSIWKKQEGGLRDPYLSIGGRSINTDNGTRYGAGAKLSLPLLESVRRGSDASGLRFETDFVGTNSGPVSISNNEGGKAYNASLGLRGYHNRNVNRDNSLSLNSNIGAGIGTGDEASNSELRPFADANLSLLKSGRTRNGTKISGGPTVSYGTEGSPTQGLRLGLKGTYGKLSGNAGYDFTNKTPKIGASLNFQTGGEHTMPDGTVHPGETHEEYMDMMQADKMQTGGKYPHDMISPETGYTISAKNEKAHSSLDNAGFTHNKMMGGGMYNQMQQYQMGGQQLPGGEMEPIPGSDAVQFNGQSHDQGGIMLDEQTEVEGGETMDQVSMAKNGGKRKDYFFSSHLKEGGVSYADMHKNILDEGGDQEKINYLAKMQEKAAGRDPGDIQTAGHGGVKEFQNGGSLDVLKFSNPDLYNQKINNLINSGTDIEYVNSVLNNVGEGSIEQWIETQDRMTKELSDKEDALNFNPEIEEEYDVEEFQLSDSFSSVDDLEKNEMYQNSSKKGQKQIRKELKSQLGKEGKSYDKIVSGSDTPLLSKLAGAAQLGSAAYSYFHKQPDAEQGSYTQGFKNPIIAERGRASKLERVNYNNERATNASDMRGLNKFIETSGGGPANIINKMAAYSKKQQGDSRINAVETRANTQIANQEAQLEQQMAVNNMSRAQQAAITNAQLIRAEAARADQINANNASARQKVKDDQEYMKYQGISQAASGLAGIAGDVLSYKGQERLARALGSNGVYNRDKLMTHFLKTKNPLTGKKYTSEEAKEATRVMYNKNNPKENS